MKTEHAAFAERLKAALEANGIAPKATELEPLVPRYGGDPVTPQAISSWLSGKHMPGHANMLALSKIAGVPPYELQFGTTHKGVREPSLAWPDHVRGRDRLAFEEYLALTDAQRGLVRDLITALAGVASRKRA